MPYFRDRNLEDQQNQNQGQGVQLSGSGMTADPSNDPNQPAQQQGSGAHFANIDNYLQNNNGAALGQQVGQKVQGSIDQARQGIDSATGEVRNQIDQAQRAPSLDQINQQVQKAGAGTTADDAKQYQGWLSQSYQGPNSIADNQAAQSRATGGIKKASTEAKYLQTEPGRFSLLDQYFGRPNYSFGQKSLDNLLVQGGGGLENPSQYRDQAAQLGGYEKQQEQGLVSAAAQKKGDIETSRINARNALGLQADGSIQGGAIGGLQDDLNNRVKTATTDRDNYYNNFVSDLSDATLDPENFAATGLRAGEQAYNIPLGQFVTKATAPSRYNVASNDDYARYKALSQLAGVDPTFLTDSSLDQAGKYDPKSTFDRDRFHKFQSAEETNLNDARNTFLDTPRDYATGRSGASPRSLIEFARDHPQYAANVQPEINWANQKLAEINDSYGANNFIRPSTKDPEEKNRLNGIRGGSA